MAGVAAALGWDRGDSGAEGRDGPRAPPPIEAYLKYESAVELFYEMTPTTRGRAVNLLEEALAIDPEFPEALGLLSFFMIVDYPGELMEFGESFRLDSAEVLVERAVRVAPNRPMVLAARGMIESFRGRLASEHHEQVLRSGVSGPARGISAIFYGYDLMSLGSLGRAIAAFEAGIGHYPLRQSLWSHAYRLAKLDPSQGLERFRDLRQTAEDAGMRPFNEYATLRAGFFGNMSWVALMAGDHEQAIALADTAVMSERRAVFRAIPGDIALFRGELAEATTHYEASMEERGGGEGNSWGMNARTNLGASLIRLGRVEEGRRFLETQWESTHSGEAHMQGWDEALAKAGVSYSVVELSLEAIRAGHRRGPYSGQPRKRRRGHGSSPLRRCAFRFQAVLGAREGPAL